MKLPSINLSSEFKTIIDFSLSFIQTKAYIDQQFLPVNRISSSSYFLMMKISENYANQPAKQIETMQDFIETCYPEILSYGAIGATNGLSLYHILSGTFSGAALCMNRNHMFENIENSSNYRQELALAIGFLSVTQSNGNIFSSIFEAFSNMMMADMAYNVIEELSNLGECY